MYVNIPTLYQSLTVCILSIHGVAGVKRRVGFAKNNRNQFSIDSTKQRPYRKDRLPRDFYCCRQLANLRIFRGICLYNTLVGIVCYKTAGQCFSGCGVWGTVDFDSKYKIL